VVWDPATTDPASAGLSGLPDVGELAHMASAMFAEGWEKLQDLSGSGSAIPLSPAAAATVSAPTHRLEAAPVPSIPVNMPRPSVGRSVSTELPTALAPYYFLGEAGTLHVPGASASDTLGIATPSTVPSQPTLIEPLAFNREVQFYWRDYRDPPTSAPAPVPHAGFDVEAIRRDFPILAERVNGRQLVWLDNAATTQKPQSVIDRLVWYYTHENSNIHRAAHELAARATDAFEAARSKVARFLGASSPDEIVFVRGATEGINLVAQTWGKTYIGAGDEIVISHLEHHANIVPWQQLATEVGAKLRVIPVDDDGQILLDAYRELISDKTRLVAIAQVSNALGTIVPVREVVKIAHAAGARVLVDGAQAVAHTRVNMATLDADFFVFSGHKVFAPTGIGVVYGKPDVLESMPPWQGGGNMIRDVTFERSTFQDPPGRFEAGTGNIADAIGLGAALDYLEGIGLENVNRYEHDLLQYAIEQMLCVPGLQLIGTAPAKASVLSFVLAGYEPGEVATALNREGIAVRAGHHCAQPILRRFGLEATVRGSLALYNTSTEIDQFVNVLQRLAGERPI
jgi:cysteine desulfurase / selenocysteine lyase